MLKYQGKIEDFLKISGKNWGFYQGNQGKTLGNFTGNPDIYTYIYIRDRPELTFTPEPEPEGLCEHRNRNWIFLIINIFLLEQS